MNGQKFYDSFNEYLKSLEKGRALGEWKFCERTGEETAKTFYHFSKGEVYLEICLWMDELKPTIDISSERKTKTDEEARVHGMSLLANQNLKGNSEQTTLLDSFDLRINKVHYKEQFRKLFSLKGIHIDVIFTITDDSPDWENSIIKLLEWEAIRVQLKRELIDGLRKKDSYSEEDVSEETKDNENIMTTHSLNQILYGPPGTGKTYNTINKALELIGVDIEKLNREEIKNLYNEKVEAGQIVFTTFHQSLSYEDFIEGIKPKTNDDGNVIYEIEGGVFKNLCIKASEKKTGINFEESYSKFVEEVSENGSIDLETPSQKKPFKVIIRNKDTAVAIPYTDKQTEMGVTKEMIKDYIINGKIRDWKPYMIPIAEYIKSNYPIDLGEIETSGKNYVLIIDEINRGNVSKIFGELITLIEESKRAGRSEAIIATLPYSKDEFSVPDNVYILGTMNTADRSVEALDTALRRRFDFVEMMPKYDLVSDDEKERYVINGISAFEILETINARIEVLLGRDHLIGHSFFLLCENETIDTRVKLAFQKNIIPLLQEYFYGDYNKIGLILGSGFVRKTKVAEPKQLFANSKDFNGDDYVSGESYIYSITELKDDSSFYKALNTLMDNTISSVRDED
jgi:hypothetical protein